MCPYLYFTAFPVTPFGLTQFSAPSTSRSLGKSKKGRNQSWGKYAEY